MSEPAPTPITSVDPVAHILSKLFVIGLSGDGGVGKTGAMNTLSDHYQANQIEVVRVDGDPDKTKEGSFSFIHKNVIKVDIRRPENADILIDAIDQSKARIVMADLGANLEAPWEMWFETMYPILSGNGFKFLFVATVTNSKGTVTALLRQSKN